MEKKIFRFEATKRKAEHVIEEKGTRRKVRTVQLSRDERLALISRLLVGDILALCANHLERAKDLLSFCLTCKAWNEAVVDNATPLIEQRQWEVPLELNVLGWVFHTAWVHGPSGTVVRAENDSVVARLFGEAGVWLIARKDSENATLTCVATTKRGPGRCCGFLDNYGIQLGCARKLQWDPVNPIFDASALLQFSSDVESTLLHWLSRFRLSDPDSKIRSVKDIITADTKFPKPIRSALGRWDTRLD